MDVKRLSQELLYMADDEFVIGAYLAEVTGSGCGPFMEENVAVSSISQDEMSHAELLYSEISKLNSEINWKTPDEFVYSRPLVEFRHSRFIESGDQDWAYLTLRHFLYEKADHYRLMKLIEGVPAPLSGTLKQLFREERYHFRHWETWMRKMTEQSDGRSRLQVQLNQWWPAFLSFYDGTYLENDTAVFQAVQIDLQAMGLVVPAHSKKSGNRNTLTEEFKRLMGLNRTMLEEGADLVW
jgi:ring-1,2-phenylacetyl-CoA epoxidase subunit PaaC